MKPLPSSLSACLQRIASLGIHLVWCWSIIYHFPSAVPLHDNGMTVPWQSHDSHMTVTCISLRANASEVCLAWGMLRLHSFLFYILAMHDGLLLRHPSRHECRYRHCLWDRKANPAPGITLPFRQKMWINVCVTRWNPGKGKKIVWIQYKVLLIYFTGNNNFYNKILLNILYKYIVITNVDFFTGTMVRRGAKEQEGADQTENPGTKFPIPNQNDICL